MAWVEPGIGSGRRSVAGPLTAVSVDITGDRRWPTWIVHPFGRCARGPDAGGRGSPVGPVLRVPAGRSAEPAGTYLVRLTARQGQVGWRSRFAAPDRADDGVSPLPVVGSALRDGQHEPGVRCLGVETPPAPNPIFRTVVAIDGDVSQARLFAVGLGYGGFSINGHPVTADVLDPARRTTTGPSSTARTTSRGC